MLREKATSLWMGSPYSLYKFDTENVCDTVQPIVHLYTDPHVANVTLGSRSQLSTKDPIGPTINIALYFYG